MMGVGEVGCPILKKEVFLLCHLSKELPNVKE